MIVPCADDSDCLLCRPLSLVSLPHSTLKQASKPESFRILSNYRNAAGVPYGEIRMGAPFELDLSPLSPSFLAPHCLDDGGKERGTMESGSVEIGYAREGKGSKGSYDVARCAETIVRD